MSLASAAVVLIAISTTMRTAARPKPPVETASSPTIDRADPQSKDSVLQLDTVGRRVAMLAEASRVRSDSLANELQKIDQRIASLDKPSKQVPDELPALRVRRQSIQREYRNARAASDSLKHLADSSALITVSRRDTIVRRPRP